MLEYLSFFVGLFGSSIAGAYDLKTTEIPDWTSVGMIGAGLLINMVRSLIEWTPEHILMSASVASAFFTFGFVLYLAGQWGGGDVKVLAGLGALLPAAPSFAAVEVLLPFPFVLVLNLFLFGAAYMIIYGLAYALLKADVASSFIDEIKEGKRRIALITALPVALSILTFLQSGVSYYSKLMIALIPLTFGLLILTRFLKVIEDEGFVEEIKTEDLEEGDMLAEPAEEIDSDEEQDSDMRDTAALLTSFFVVPAAMVFVGFTGNIYFYISIPPGIVGSVLLLGHFLVQSELLEDMKLFRESSSRIRGLKEEEVEKIRETRDKVKIKEGVRFAPTFPVALLITVYFGNVIFAAMV